MSKLLLLTLLIKMSSCQKCQMLLHTLKNEIEECQLREQ